MSKRMLERNNEIMRQGVKTNIKQFMKTQNGANLVKFVDQQPLEKMYVTRYATYTKNLKKTLDPENYTDMEKYRSRKGDYSYHPCEMELEVPLEKIYFDAYGVGFDGSPFPTRIGAPIVCRRCGLKFETSPKLLPEYCPVCHRETVLGELIHDKILRR